MLDTLRSSVPNNESVRVQKKHFTYNLWDQPQEFVVSLLIHVMHNLATGMRSPGENKMYNCG